MQKMINAENALFFYRLQSFPYHKKFFKSFVNRNFLTLSKTINFLELDIESVCEIFKSSQLNITSELEVLMAQESWVGYDPMRRKKHLIKLLLTVRLHLLSNHALINLHRFFAYNKREECLFVVKQVYQDKESCRNTLNLCSTPRYCSEDAINVLFYKSSDVNSWKHYEQGINNKSLTSLPTYPNLKVNDYYFQAVFIAGEVFCIINDSKLVMKIHKYSVRNNSWENCGQIHGYDLFNFSACAFFGKIFLLGGQTKNPNSELQVENIIHKDCYEIDPITMASRYTIRPISGLNRSRASAASAVFEGHIVVAGGIGNGGVVLKTAEKYDQFPNAWSRMPSMVSEGVCHLVPVKSKLFAI